MTYFFTFILTLFKKKTLRLRKLWKRGIWLPNQDSVFKKWMLLFIGWKLCSVPDIDLNTRTKQFKRDSVTEYHSWSCCGFQCLTKFFLYRYKQLLFMYSDKQKINIVGYLTRDLSRQRRSFKMHFWKSRTLKAFSPLLCSSFNDGNICYVNAVLNHSEERLFTYCATACRKFINPSKRCLTTGRYSSSVCSFKSV